MWKTRLKWIALGFILFGGGYFFWNRPHLERDDRYSDLSLEVNSAPVSLALVSLLNADNYLEATERPLAELLTGLSQLNPLEETGGSDHAQHGEHEDHADHADHADHNHQDEASHQTSMEAREGLIRAAKELLTQHDKELAMARKAFSEEGCADDLSPRDGKTSPMNLLYAGRLLSLSLDHDRLTGFTHYAVKQIKDLIRSVQNKRYTCPHAILNFMVFTQVEITLKQVGLRLLGTTKAPEQREELLRILRADLNADSERGDREAFQQSVRVEFLQNKQLLQESGLLKGMKTLRPAQKTESALNFWPFLDEEEAIEWLSEAARAQVWILGVPAHEELPADLRVSRFKEELDTFSNPWMYNGFGAQLFKVLHMSVSALRDTHIRSNCQWRYRFKKELDRLKIEGPAIINPYTTRSFKQRRNPCQPRAPYDRL